MGGTPSILKNQKSASEITDPSFSIIHLVKTYHDVLLNNDKMSVVTQLAQTAGYDVSIVDLPLLKKYDEKVIESIKNSSQSHKEIVNQVYDKIFAKQQMNEAEKRIQVNLVSKIYQYMPLFGINNIKDINDIFHECIIDQKKMDLYINKKFLKISREDLRHKYIDNKDIHKTVKTHCLNIMHRIFALETIEDILEIQRYDVTGIKPDIDIPAVKTKLTKSINDIVKLDTTETSKKKLIELYQTKIQNIDSFNKLQKFLADAYNSFGNIIQYTTKRLRINGIQQTIYYFQ